MRWRQDATTGKLIPTDAAAARRDGHSIHTNSFDAFRSPVDGSVITGDRSLREHNARNNVVNAAEFTPEFYESKAKERADFFQGKLTKQERHSRRQHIYDKWIQAERDHG